MVPLQKPVLTDSSVSTYPLEKRAELEIDQWSRRPSKTCVFTKPDSVAGSILSIKLIFGGFFAVAKKLCTRWYIYFISHRSGSAGLPLLPLNSVTRMKEIIISRRGIIKGVSFGGGCEVQLFPQDVLLNTALALFSAIRCNYSGFEPFDLTTLSLGVSQILLIKSKWPESYSLPGTSTGPREGMQRASLQCSSVG